MSLFAELRRRNVIRMAGLYLVVAWLFVQVAETLLPIFDTPGWVLKALVTVLALGFLPALVFAWVFELTPEGLKRDGDARVSGELAPQTSQRMNRMIIALLLVAVGYFAVEQFVLSPRRAADVPVAAQATPAAGAAGAAEPAIIDKSIAVLPFADFSAGGDQAWFADGLSEEVLNALANISDLRVSARTSSFAFKGSSTPIPEIARQLGVSYVLEGSVRSSPERIRVTAQLIRAADGFHLWSQNYDRDPAEMIAIQEDLAQKIAQALQTTTDPAALADMARVGTRSVEAYQAYMRGVAADLGEGLDSWDRAYRYFEQSQAIDPDFAAPAGRAARILLWQGDPNQTRKMDLSESPDGVDKLFAERINRAIRHAANPSQRNDYLATKAMSELRLRDALALYKSSFAERPSDATIVTPLLDVAIAASDYTTGQAVLDAIWTQSKQRPEMALASANFGYRTLDRRLAADRALELYARWPDRANILYQVHRSLLWDGRVQDAARVLADYRRLGMVAEAWASIPEARQACAEGRREKVEQLLAQTPEANVSQQWHLLVLLGRNDEAAEVLQPFERTGLTYALYGFLAYPHFDPRPYPSLMKVLEREHVQRPPPEPLPFGCPPAGASQ